MDFEHFYFLHSIYLLFLYMFLIIMFGLIVLLVAISICTAVGAWQWLVDPETMQVSFLQSLYNHLFFTLSSLSLGEFFKLV